MVSPSVSIITGVKGRLAALRQSLPTWLAIPGAEVVVVDYDCPEGSGAWAAAQSARVRVVRLTDRPHYHPAAAHNLGRRAAIAPWLLFVDADVKLDPGISAVLNSARPGSYYHADQNLPGLSGTVLVHHAAFDLADGYDETYQAWGWEDADFFQSLRYHGVEPATFPAGLLSHIPHDDAARMRFYAEKNIARTTLHNMLYCAAKLDLLRLTSEQLPPQARTELYQNLARFIDHAATTGQPQGFPIPLAANSANGWQFQRQLLLVLAPPSPPSTTATTPGNR